MRRELECARPSPGGLSVARLRGLAHGVDLGPLETCLERRLATPDRRIGSRLSHISMTSLALREASGAPLPELVLIGRRHVAATIPGCITVIVSLRASRAARL